MRTLLQITSTLVAIMAVTASSTASGNFVHDVASDFSFSNNPNGAWTYGWTQTLGSEFTLDVHKRTFDGGLQQWMGNPNGDAEDYGHPSVFYNPNSVPTGNGYLVPVNGVAFHPGLAGTHTAIRWTAPISGEYRLTAAFTKLHFGATDVYILKNGNGLFSGTTGFAPLSYSSHLVVSAGDTIDFMAGSGIDGYYGDTTGVAATLTIVPEPGGAISIGMVSIAVAARRRRKDRSQPD